MTAERPTTPTSRLRTRASAEHRQWLRCLAEGDCMPGPLPDATCSGHPHGLDARAAALARLAALMASGAAPTSYERGVDLALAAGASVDDVLDTLKVVAPTVGLARVVSAAPGLARAVGYDMETALEALDEP